MHRPTMRAKRAVQERLGVVDVALPPARELAVGWLDDKIAAGQAGLDSYDRTVFIVEADANERVWARTVSEVCGLFLSEHAGEYRMVLDAGVRDRLGLDRDDAPLMPDVALGSRGVDTGPTAVMEAVFAALEPRPVLTLLESADDRVVH